jgi:hypothetical protein
MDWLVTLPQKTLWSDYEKELKAVEDGEFVLNFRLPARRYDIQPGDRFFITWCGLVRGWMEVSRASNRPEGFKCITTGTTWPPGFYVERSGKFHYVQGPEVRGFQGVRRVDFRSLYETDRKGARIDWYENDVKCNETNHQRT